VSQQVGEAAALFFGEALGAFEQQPAAFGQHRFLPLGLEFARLLGTHLVDGLTEVVLCALMAEAVDVAVEKAPAALGQDTGTRRGLLATIPFRL